MKKLISAMTVLLILISVSIAQSSGSESLEESVVSNSNDLKNHIDLVFIVGYDQSIHSWVILGSGFIVGDNTVIAFKSFFDFIGPKDYSQFGVGVIDAYSNTLMIKDVLLIKKIIITSSYLKLKVSGHLLEYW